MVLSICRSVYVVTPVLRVAYKGRPRLQQMAKDDPHLVMTSGSSPEHNIIRQVDNDSTPKERADYTCILKARSVFKPK